MTGISVHIRTLRNFSTKMRSSVAALGARVALAELAGCGDLQADTAASDQTAVSAASVARGDRAPLVALYFGAAWCGPCQQFSPELARFARTAAARSSLQVVFVSADESSAAAESFARGKGFLAVPHDASDARRAITNALNIRAYPTLIVLDTRSKKVVTRWGRAAISMEKQDGEVVREWLAGRGMNLQMIVSRNIAGVGLVCIILAALVILVRRLFF